MRIFNTDNKTDVESRSKRVMTISLVAPAILLVLITVFIVYFVSMSLDRKIRDNLSSVTDAAAEGKYVDVEDFSDYFFPKCKIFYYDAAGNVLEGEAGFAMKYSKEVDGQRVKVGSTTYESMSKTMKTTEDGYCYVIVYRDIGTELELLRTVTWVMVGILIFSIVLIVIVTYLVVRMQSKHYEQALKRNNQLVSDISHEFNTPLAIIKTSLAKALSEPEKTVEEVSESLITVTHEAGRLNRMVRDMLILSRSDADRMIVEKKNCNVTELISSIIEPFQMMCELDNKTMTAKLAPSVQCRTDEDKIKQAVIILLDNAVKYTKPGDSINLTLKDGFGRFYISVADTGIGVPENELQNVFERFYRTDNSRNSETGGSGLGLSIIKAIVQVLKGKVAAKQNKPKGFRVDLEFPKEKFT